MDGGLTRFLLIGRSPGKEYFDETLTSFSKTPKPYF
jgi:hypothetical protein